jgi:hypothetical protein
MMVDGILLMIVIAGMGLAAAYLMADMPYVGNSKPQSTRN